MTRKRPFNAYDSDLGEDYPNHRIYCVSYEPAWQSIRYELHWADLDQAVGSLARVDAYVNIAPASELQYRVWRVYNLLCAIPHGQVSSNGFRIIGRPSTGILTLALDRYRDKIYDVGFPTEWDWANVRDQLLQMKSTMPAVLKKNVQHLRQARAGRHEAKPELRYYLNMCEEVEV